MDRRGCMGLVLTPGGTAHLPDFTRVEIKDGSVYLPVYCGMTAQYPIAEWHAARFDLLPCDPAGICPGCRVSATISALTT